MKKFFKKLKKHWITVWFVVVVLTVGSFVSFASYTGIYSVKRVVSTTASAGVLFSSNSMQTYASADSIAARHLTTSQSSGNYTYNLTVCDFAQSDPLTRYVSENGLDYSMTAQLCVKINGNYYPVSDTTNVGNDIRADALTRDFSIQYVSDGGTDVSTENQVLSLSGGSEVSYTGTITPSGNGTNKYTITFDEYELGNNQIFDYYVKVTAEPTNVDNTLESIACYLYLTKSVAQNSTWTGRLQETSELANYDAYNYIVEGSGSGTATVRWNSNYIDVSEIFLAQNGLTNSVVTEAADANNNVWKRFELDVGDEINGTVISRYEIQLYKNNENGNYNNISSYISCSYIAD